MFACALLSSFAQKLQLFFWGRIKLLRLFVELLVKESLERLWFLCDPGCKVRRTSCRSRLPFVLLAGLQMSWFNFVLWLLLLR